MSYLQNIELPASINQVKRFGMVNSLLWSRLNFLFGARWLLLFVGCSLLFAGCFLLFTISHTCSPYLLSRWAFYIFFSGVTQSNEDAGWVQDFTLLFLCLVQIKRIRRQGKSRILSCIPSGGSFSSDLLRAVISYWAESHLESFQTPAMEHSWENNTWTISTKKLHRRCSTGLRLCLRLKVQPMWDESRLQVYEICNRRLVYSKIVEARSNDNYWSFFP